MIRSVAVFCGSSTGNLPVYREKAASLGTFLANKGIELIYGGGNIGLMGAVADAAMAAGGHVSGVIPKGLLDKELAHEGISKMFVVNSMHERKALMAGKADAFITLPGGFGTFDEFFEILSWNQLGIISKPCALYNINDYFEPMVRMLEQARDNLFIREEHYKNLIIAQSEEELWEKITHFKPLTADSWIDELKSM